MSTYFEVVQHLDHGHWPLVVSAFSHISDAQPHYTALIPNVMASSFARRSIPCLCVMSPCHLALLYSLIVLGCSFPGHLPFVSTLCPHEPNALLPWSSLGLYVWTGAAGGPKRNLASLALPTIGKVKDPQVFLHNVKELHCS